MFFQYPIQVNAIKNDTRAKPTRTQVRTKMFLESAPSHAEIAHGFLTVVATLVLRSIHEASVVLNAAIALANFGPDLALHFG